jgi:2-polyprenyl-6-methoxyphenol hydroxylase-like FAD-dependent oxidoreductase
MADQVAIIGAGLSGITLALALHQQGIKPTVYEQRPAPLNIGGAVMLSPNALKVLDALGVYQEIRGKGYNFELLEMQKPDGEFIETYEFGGQDKYGYQANRVYRYELIDAILAKLKAEGVSVVFGRKYSRIVEETDDHVVWESTDGQQSTASWLVGADGIHSTVRKYLYPDLTPKFTGMAGITAGVSAEGVTHLGQKITQPLTIISADKGAFVIAPQKVDGSEFLIGKQKTMGELSREEWDRFLGDRDQLIAFLKQDADVFGPVAVSSTANVRAEKMNVWPFYVIPELERWASAKRRVVILGDSAHAIPPSAGQGINQAFEDVYMFALLLAAVKAGHVPFEDALTFWQGYRQGRVNRILELNKQIDLRRMPKGSTISGGEAAPDAQVFDLKWLYEPDFKAEVDAFVQRTVKRKTAIPPMHT